MLRLCRDSHKRYLVVEATGPDRKRYRANDCLTSGAIALELVRGTRIEYAEKKERDSNKQT